MDPPNAGPIEGVVVAVDAMTRYASRMRVSSHAPFSMLLPALLGLAACTVPTLTRGSTGWHEAKNPYSIAPLEDGALVPAGWKLVGYSIEKGGFYRELTDDDAPDLKLVRSEDDGVLLITHGRVTDVDFDKRPEVLAERWIDRVVRNPKEDDDERKRFLPVVPLLQTSASGSVGLHVLAVTTVRGRDVRVDSHDTFSLQAGEGAEYIATLAPAGESPDRRLYLAVVKQSGGKFAMVAYGNTPAMFDKGLADASAFAHRLRF